MRAVAALLLLLCAAPSRASETYTVTDKGGFGGTGRFIEFADRYGWESYEVKYRLELDASSRKLGEDSLLTLSIKKKDGKTWKYRCRVESDAETGRLGLWANINNLYGRGTSVLTECRVDAHKFAKFVGLDADMVGSPTLVFHATVNGGEAKPGIQKGIYFLSSGEVEGGPLSQYLNRSGDPSDLAVVFASSDPAAHTQYFSTAARTPSN